MMSKRATAARREGSIIETITILVTIKSEVSRADLRLCRVGRPRSQPVHRKTKRAYSAFEIWDIRDSIVLSEIQCRFFLCCYVVIVSCAMIVAVVSILQEWNDGDDT